MKEKMKQMMNHCFQLLVYQGTTNICDMSPRHMNDILQLYSNKGILYSERGVRHRGHLFFVMKIVLFVEASVAVNTKLTSKVPLLFRSFNVFRRIREKRAISIWYEGNLPPP